MVVWNDGRRYVYAIDLTRCNETIQLKLMLVMLWTLATVFALNWH